MKAKKGGNFNPVVLPKPATVVARCYSVIHIGHVTETFKGQSGVKEKVHITWEMPSLKAVFDQEKGEQPFVIGQEFTLSTKDNSNFAKLIAQWRNKPLDAKEQQGFDPTVLVGKTCLLSFIVKRKKDYTDQQIAQPTSENSYLVLNTISQRPADFPAPAAVNPPFIFDWDKPFDPQIFEKIPKFIQEKIKMSEEWRALSDDKKGLVSQEASSGDSQESPEAGESIETEGEW